eukprot:SAG11_NODE_13214_length_665_cov_1.143110_1_plen_79_part_00
MGAEEETSWQMALATLEEEETLEQERLDLDAQLLARASVVSEDLEMHVNKNTQHDPSTGSAQYHVVPRRDSNKRLLPS